jgi:hypothetical protein
VPARAATLADPARPNAIGVAIGSPPCPSRGVVRGVRVRRGWW